MNYFCGFVTALALVILVLGLAPNAPMKEYTKAKKACHKYHERCKIVGVKDEPS